MHKQKPSNIEKFASNPITSIMLTTLSALIPPISIGKDMIDKSVTKIQEDRFNTLLDEMSEGDIELTEEIINSEEFIHSFVIVYRSVIHTYDRQKIRHFARLLISGINHEELASDTFSEYVRLLDDLSVRELYLLNLLFKLEQEHCDKNPDNCEDTKSVMTHAIWKHFVKLACTNLQITEDILVSIMLGLTRSGLYHLMAGVTMDYSKNIGIGQTTSMWAGFTKWIELQDS